MQEPIKIESASLFYRLITILTFLAREVSFPNSPVRCPAIPFLERRISATPSVPLRLFFEDQNDPSTMLHARDADHDESCVNHHKRIPGKSLHPSTTMGLEVGSLPIRTAVAATSTTAATAATAVSFPSSAVMTDDTTNAPIHSIERATYPLPPPLTLRLKAAILPQLAPSNKPYVTVNVDAPVVLIETPATALQYLVENSLTAMDLMYFATPATIRQDSICMSHRLCLRIATNRTLKTLTITDLGIGMTRADMINILGVGRTMNNGPAAIHGRSDADGAAKRRVSTSTNSTSGTASSDDDDDEEDDDDDDNDDTNDNDNDATQDDDETAEEDDDHDNQSSDRHGKKNNNNNNSSKNNHHHNNANTLSCKKTDLGGFYSALCAIGMGVKVGTKVQQVSGIVQPTWLCHATKYSLFRHSIFAHHFFRKQSLNLMTTTSFR
jgi:hypothetical protein